MLRNAETAEAAIGGEARIAEMLKETLKRRRCRNLLTRQLFARAGEMLKSLKRNAV